MKLVEALCKASECEATMIVKVNPEGIVVRWDYVDDCTWNFEELQEEGWHIAESKEAAKFTLEEIYERAKASNKEIPIIFCANKEDISRRFLVYPDGDIVDATCDEIVFCMDYIAEKKWFIAYDGHKYRSHEDDD